MVLLAGALRPPKPPLVLRAVAVSAVLLAWSAPKPLRAPLVVVVGRVGLMRSISQDAAVGAEGCPKPVDGAEGCPNPLVPELGCAKAMPFG